MTMNVNFLVFITKPNGFRFGMELYAESDLIVQVFCSSFIRQILKTAQEQID